MNKEWWPRSWATQLNLKLCTEFHHSVRSTVGYELLKGYSLAETFYFQHVGADPVVRNCQPWFQVCTSKRWCTSVTFVFAQASSMCRPNITFTWVASVTYKQWCHLQIGAAHFHWWNAKADSELGIGLLRGSLFWLPNCDKRNLATYFTGTK